MAQIIWTEPALDDLNHIAEYIAVSHPFAARQLVEKVFNYRELVVNPCRVFYKVDKDLVYILHVLRQERDLRKFLLSGENEN